MVTVIDTPDEAARREAGRIAISLAQLIRQRRTDDVRALLAGMTVEEWTCAVFAQAALNAALSDQLDAVCAGQGLPAMAHDTHRMWLAVLDHQAANADDGTGPWRD
jgi:hypothetical protein